MKKSKMPKTFFAFLIAVGLAFTLKQPQTTVGMIDVKGKGSNCPSGQVSDTCLATAEDQICTFKFNKTKYEAVSSNVTECSDASVLRRPD